MGKPHDSILVGYYRNLTKAGFVIIPNYKLLKKFTEKYSNLHPTDKLQIKIVNGSLKPCVREGTRCRLRICTSILFKYIDSGRICYDVSLDCDFHIELKNKIMDSSLNMSERIEALDFYKISGPIYAWKYFKRWYKVLKITT